MISDSEFNDAAWRLCYLRDKDPMESVAYDSGCMAIVKRPYWMNVVEELKHHALIKEALKGLE